MHHPCFYWNVHPKSSTDRSWVPPGYLQRARLDAQEIYAAGRTVISGMNYDERSRWFLMIWGHQYHSQKHGWGEAPEQRAGSQRGANPKVATRGTVDSDRSEDSNIIIFFVSPPWLRRSEGWGRFLLM